MDRLVVGEDKFVRLGAVGTGTFAIVYRGQDLRTHPPRDVAIKVLRGNLSSHCAGRAFVNELGVMARLKHPGTLELIGLVNPLAAEEAMIITPFMANGSVADMIKAERQGRAPVQWNGTAKSMLVFGVAAAMTYIHSEGVLHRDLKAANILLNDNFEPVIADYGFSRLQGLDLTMQVGSPLYMAPELIRERDDTDGYTQKVDVFAYAVFLHQLFTDSVAMDDGRGNPRTCQQVLERVLAGARLKRADTIPDFYWKMITECWAGEPNDRPPFCQIVRAFLDSDEWIFPGTDRDLLHEYQMRVLEGVPLGISVPIDDDVDGEGMEEPLRQRLAEKYDGKRRW